MRFHRTAGIGLGAILVSIVLGYVNLHNDEVQMPLAILLLSTFLLGFFQPKQAWRWAVIIGLGVPLSSLVSLKIGVFYPCRPGHPYSCEGAGSVGNAVSTFALLIPALVSTYLGVLTRCGTRLREEA